MSRSKAMSEQSGSPVRVRTRPAPVTSTNEEQGATISKSADAKLDWVNRLALKVEYVPASELRPYDKNARTHSKKQIKKVAASIAKFGFVNPILIGRDGDIVAGHCRLLAALSLGYERVPVVRLDHLTDEQRRAYRIADNRLAEIAGWDNPTLASELKSLFELDGSFECDVLGFEMSEVDVLLTSEADSGPDPADAVEEPEGPAVSRIGELWHLGPHRLLCADARESASFMALLGGELAQMVITDMPYNLKIEGFVTGPGKTKHREFPMASGEMDEAEFTEFLRTVFTNLANASMDGAITYAFMDWRHMGEILKAGREVYSEFKNLIVWAKDNAGLGSFYRSRHELVFVFKKGTAPHINNFELGQSGRYRTNIWEYAGSNSFRRGRTEELGNHPTPKPTGMIADAILDCSRRGGIVLDAFGGSGTTIIAAERVGRRGYLIEIDARYVDVTIRRWQKHFGVPARHAITGETFEEVAASRLADGEVGHG
jgi:DNA modification methylase